MFTEHQDCFVCGNDDDTLFDVISVGEEGDDVILLRHCLLCNDVTHVDKSQSQSEVDILKYFTDSTPLCLSKPCPECKTNDPNNFVIQGIDQLQCIVCQSIVNLHASDVTLQHSSSPSSNSTEITQVVASVRVKRRRLTESDNGEQFSTPKRSRGSDHNVIWYSPPIDDDCSAQPIECQPVWYSPPIESEHHNNKFAGQEPVWYSPPIEDDEASLVTRNVIKNTKFEFPLTAMSMANTPRTEMNTFSSLSPGDHITQQRPLGYWHHAIVLSVTSADIITVIHYSQADEGRLFGEIRLQEYTVAEWNGGRVFYRLDYPDGCLPADEVLDRAFSRLGERHYNPLTNNCEHFARWCKIARPVSLQVKNVAKELIASAAGNALLPFMYGQLASTVASPLVNPLKLAVSLGVELRTTVKELRLLESMREKGLITADEWKRARLRQMAACSTACLSSGLTGVTGTLVGFKVGGLLGSLVVPLGGSFIGAVLGKVIGTITGGWLASTVPPSQSS